MKQMKSIRGLATIGGWPPISTWNNEEGRATTRQQFIDDTMLHGIPKMKEARSFKSILDTFTSASVMETNLSKFMNCFCLTLILLSRGIE